MTETDQTSWAPEKGRRSLSSALLLVAMDILPEDGTFQTVLKDMISTRGLGRGMLGQQARQKEIVNSWAETMGSVFPWSLAVLSHHLSCLLNEVRQQLLLAPPPSLPSWTYN